MRRKKVGRRLYGFDGEYVDCFLTKVRDEVHCGGQAG